jgi:hypothetical protein
MWNWFGFLALFIAVTAIVWFFHPGIRRERQFKAELAARESISDEELFRHYFASNGVAPDVPGRVRRIFAKHTQYPADKLLPDDDLMFVWHEMDSTDLVRDVDREFGIEITGAEAESVPHCSIRAVTELVSRKTSKASHET